MYRKIKGKKNKQTKQKINKKHLPCIGSKAISLGAKPLVVKIVLTALHDDFGAPFVTFIKNIDEKHT